MKNCNLYIIVFTTLFTQKIWADNKILFIGGGGEPKNISSTIFDQSLNNFAQFIQSNNWKSDLVFNGGHAQTEAIIDKKFNSSNTKSTITKNNFNNMVSNYNNQMLSGAIRPGESVMVMIDSHGAMRSEYGDEKTHQIAVGQAPSNQGDLNNLSGTPTLNLDSLKILADTAKAKGIKLAIVDFSCHSGNSLPLANEATCVISSSGTNHFGYTSFSESFISKMKKGKTLEDVFLETRKTTFDQSYPMISSPEGKQINNDLYPGLTPYLYYYDKDPHLDKMEKYLSSASTNMGLCQRENQFKNLNLQLDSIRAANILNMSNNFPEINNLKSLILKYKSQQDKYINLMRSWGVKELDRKEIFIGLAKVGNKTGRMDGNYTWKEIVETDYDLIIKNVTEALNSTKDPQTLAEYKASIEMHSKAREKQKELLIQFPKLKNYNQNFKASLVEMEGTMSTANQIAQEERKLYDAIYGSMKKNNKQSNPCSDFIL